MFYVGLYNRAERIRPGYEESGYQGLIGFSDMGRAEESYRAHLSIIGAGETVTLYDAEKKRVIRKKTKGAA